MALAAVAAALIALLLLYGASYVAKLVAHLIPTGLPLIGSKLRNAVETAASAAVHAVASWLDAAVSPIETALTAPFYVFHTCIDLLFSVSRQLQRAVEWLHSVRLPQITAWVAWKIGQALTAIDTRIGQVADWVTWKIGQAVSAIDARIGQVTDWVAWKITGAVAGVEADLASGIGTVERDLTRAVAGVEADLAAVAAGEAHALAAAISGVEADLSATARQLTSYVDQRAAAALAAAETYATTAAGQAVGALVTDVDNLLEPVAAGVIDDLDTLAGTLATDFPDVSQLLREVDLSRLAGMAGALTGSLAIARVLTRLAEDCTVPNCRNLGKFGRELQALLGVVEGAGFLAFLTAMITEPEPTAHAIESAIGTVARDTAHGIADLIGV